MIFKQLKLEAWGTEQHSPDGPGTWCVLSSWKECDNCKMVVPYECLTCKENLEKLLENELESTLGSQERKKLLKLRYKFYTTFKSGS